MASPIRLIVVPIDFSTHSEEALRYAQSLAQALDASLHLIHVVDVMAGAWGTEFSTVDLSGLQAEMIEDAERRMTVTRGALASKLVPVDSSVIIGPPAIAIADRAATLGADLIVMGTHGRTGLPHLMMGSVAERVMRIAPCPVLTIRTATGQAAHAA